VSGGDRVFTNLALAVAGHRRGGPAKVAVISSAMMGTLSGSTVSNVVTTGSLTIPMMKRLGFKPYEAAAIETTASLGGALTPPLMGAGVFIMSSFAGVPLITILMYSIIPALLYFTSLYFYVDVKARKKGLSGLPRELLPKVWTVIRDGGHIFIPIFVLIYLLIEKWTPFLASSACVVGVFLISFVRKNTRMTPRKILIALEGATRVTMTVSALGASAALIYGVITVTGLLVKVTSIILAVAGGSLFIGIVLIALMSYVLGMGLPVTAAYVLIAALGSPALQDLGLPVLAAHLVIFWFSQDSTITPPICMTAFVGARIAKAPPMKTGWQCVLMAKALYIIPFVFAYGSLLDESWAEVFFDGMVLFLLFASMPLFVEGFYFQKISWGIRIPIGLAGVGFFMACIGPMTEGYLWLAGSAVVLIAAMRYERNRAAGAMPSS
ncbi:MAG: TRAP transporter fused permease subunit, partial [Rhodospirillaceae bacterium]|nr:TRAP transporter fused permease subunit [Rhodospirillaceae bacterium]